MTAKSNIETTSDEKLEKATFAGGCFWCMEHPFDSFEGVKSVIPGYTGGYNEAPTYEEVCSGDSGHYEAVQILFDPNIISYNKLLSIFWRQIDPTDPRGQFVDRGSQYKTAVFYHNETQKSEAEKSKKALNASGRFQKKIVTEILEAETFYPAEDYHQGYYKKCPLPYTRYRSASGRDAFLKRVWGDETDEPSTKSTEKTFVKPPLEELKGKLNPVQFQVTQKNGTERAFDNEFWDNKADGIYVDIVSGEVLFSSKDKFDSGTGWPSFTKPLVVDNIKKLKDRSLFMTRTEVRSQRADSHLGHVFDDGPAPTGQRYCINSASLRFIPKADLKAEGYEDFSRLFE